jgi:hypothetical protein
VKEDHGVGQNGSGIDVNLVATVHEGSKVHFEGSGDVIEGDPLVLSQPHDSTVRVEVTTYNS